MSLQINQFGHASPESEQWRWRWSCSDELLKIQWSVLLPLVWKVPDDNLRIPFAEIAGFSLPSTEPFTMCKNTNVPISNDIISGHRSLSSYTLLFACIHISWGKLNYRHKNSSFAGGWVDIIQISDQVILSYRKPQAKECRKQETKQTTKFNIHSLYNCLIPGPRRVLLYVCERANGWEYQSWRSWDEAFMTWGIVA